jgi:hypothetical protein
MRVPELGGAMRATRATRSVINAVGVASRARPPLVAPLARKREVFWWEFESELKRRIALEVLMRMLFAMQSVRTGIAQPT